jgi:hypothetical protein
LSPTPRRGGKIRVEGDLRREDEAVTGGVYLSAETVVELNVRDD